MRHMPEPARDQIDVTLVLEALSDPIRLGVVRFLADREAARGDSFEAPCGRLGGFTSKTNLSYHLARLREAGVTRTRIDGTRRLISLRREDMEVRFPGLLASIVAAARARDDLPVLELAD